MSASVVRGSQFRDTAAPFLAGMRRDLLFLSSLFHLIIAVVRREGGNRQLYW